MTVNWETLTEGTQLSPATLRSMLQTWPYFIWPALQLLESGTTDASETARLRTSIALAIGDRNTLTSILDPDTDFTDFYPDMKPVQLTSDATIDAFLNRYGNNDKETDLLTGMIFDSNARRAPLLNQQDDEQEDDTPTPGTRSDAARIDAFLNQSPQPTRTPESLMHLEATTAGSETNDTPITDASPSPTTQDKPTPTPRAAKKPILTLSLVNMMIKNHNYSKALDILTELSLANPEKSIIFADQIRFLKKLILISKQ